MGISQINGSKIDGRLLQAFMNATTNDGKITGTEIKEKIAKFLVDDNSFSRAEKNTVLFAMQHLKFSTAGDKELAKLITQLRPTQTTQNALIARGVAPKIPFSELYDNLEAQGRMADMYAVKSVMRGPAMEKLWTEGMTLVDFNNLLKKALRPVAADTIRKDFKDWNVDDVVSSMTKRQKERFEAGEMSRGEFQNLIYRAWEKEDPSIKGRTPYQEGYKAVYQPLV